MIRPVDAEISQRYGENPTRDLPADSWLIRTFGNYQPDGHTGEDYSCPIGTPVRAVAAGTVLHVGWMGGTYADNPWWVAPGFAGYCAVIDHGSFIGIYGHCLDGSAGVSAGDRVTEGQVFIRSGNTGGSTGPHLHFEILPDGYVLNSRFYGRTDPETLFAASSLSYEGSITNLSSSIIQDLEESGVALDKADLEAIQNIINPRLDEVINDNRAQVKFYAEELAQVIKDSNYEMKVFTQNVVNPRIDEAILDNRAQEELTRQQQAGKP